MFVGQGRSFFDNTEKMMTSNNKTLFQFYISFIPIIFLISVFSYLMFENLYIVLICFSLAYIITLVYAIIKSGAFSLYSIYLYTSAFFIYDAFFFTLFSKDRNFLNQEFPVLYSFSERTGFIFVICCFLAVFFTHIVYIYFLKIQNKKLKLKEFRYKLIQNPLWKQISVIALFIFLFPVLYKIFLQVRYVMKIGYKAMYIEGLDIEYPFWCNGAFTLFCASYYVFIASRPDKKDYIIVSILFLIVYTANSLKGGRGAFICCLLTVVYYYQISYSRKKISLNKILILGICVFAIAIILGNLRNSYGKDNVGLNLDSILIVLEYLLWGQTNTKAVPMLIIDREIKYRRFPFVFWPISNLILPKLYPFKNNEMGALITYNNPSQILLANLSLPQALKGAGYGSAFIAEAYDFCGYFGVIIFHFLLGILLSFFDCRKMKVKNIYIPFLYIVLFYIPLLPRYYTLYIFNNIKYILTSYAFIFCIELFFRPIINREKNLRRRRFY